MSGSLRASALALASTLLVASSAWAQANLLTDGTMEAADAAAWPAYSGGTFAKTSADAYNGSQSMHLTQAGTTAGFQQVVGTVQAGKTYRLKLYYKRVSGNFGVRVGVGTSNGDFENHTFSTTTSPNAWGAYSRVFTLPAQLNGTVRVVVFGTGESFVDDVTLTENTIMNDGDMEAADTSAWVAYGNATYAKQNMTVFNGTQAMSVNAGGFQQRFLPVQPGATYNLAVHYKRDSGSITIRMGMNTSNTDSFGGGLTTASGTDNAWVSYNRTVTMPASITGDVRLVFRCTGVCYIDDVAMTSPELLHDWNAEAADVGAWSVYGSYQTLEKVNAGVYAGTRSLHLVQGGIQQINIPVTAGATYNLSLFYKNNSGRFRVRLGNNTSNSDFAGGEFSTAVVGDWAQYTRQFTVPANFTGSWRLIIISDRGGDVDLDNTSITPAN
jgi:hypothetical protein